MNKTFISNGLSITSYSNELFGDRENVEFLELVKSEWAEKHEEPNVFRYKINNLQERLIDGKYLLQLNPDRSSKRRTPEQIENMCQPFDKNKFNFTKVSPKEIMFNLETEDSDVHMILVNVSPISQYHSLLCPSVHKCLPQVVTEDSIKLALIIMFLTPDRAFRVGFNSLCALASVNHLHYHLFLERNILPVETAKCYHLKGPLYCLNKDYPVPAFCFEVRTQDSVGQISKEIFKLLSYFLKNSLAHNIMITRGRSLVLSGDTDSEVVRVIVWPRKSSTGAKQLTAFNVAVCELSGWFPVFSKHDFETLTTEDLVNELRKWKVDNFEELCEKVQLLF